MSGLTRSAKPTPPKHTKTNTQTNTHTPDPRHQRRQQHRQHHFCSKCECASLDHAFSLASTSCARCAHGPMQHYSWWNRHVANPIRNHGFTGRGKAALLVRFCGRAEGEGRGERTGGLAWARRAPTRRASDPHRPDTSLSRPPPLQRRCATRCCRASCCAAPRRSAPTTSRCRRARSCCAASASTSARPTSMRFDGGSGWGWGRVGVEGVVVGLLGVWVVCGWSGDWGRGRDAA